MEDWACRIRRTLAVGPEAWPWLERLSEGEQEALYTQLARYAIRVAAHRGP